MTRVCEHERMCVTEKRKKAHACEDIQNGEVFTMMKDSNLLTEPKANLIVFFRRPQRKNEKCTA